MSEEPHFYRAFPTEVERTGPNQLTGRLVPWDVVADVADPTIDGSYDIYREGFRRGAFEPQIKAIKTSKISLVHRHFASGLGFLGPFIALRDLPDGLYGDVKIVTSKRADVEDLLEAGVNELSIEFRLRTGEHTEVDGTGVRWRRRCHLDAVALEPKGAYSTAQVIAFRSEADEAARQQAEREAEEAAERQRQADEEEAERQRQATAEAEAADRRARWNEMTERYDRDVTKQGELVRNYGVTQH
jgi:HK97 family phage prohead protease